MAKQKATHGGKRPGAGRKSALRSKSGAEFVTMPVSLPADVRDVLDELANRNGRSRSQEVLSLLASSSPKIQRLIVNKP